MKAITQLRYESPMVALARLLRLPRIAAAQLDLAGATNNAAPSQAVHAAPLLDTRARTFRVMNAILFMIGYRSVSARVTES